MSYRDLALNEKILTFARKNLIGLLSTYENNDAGTFFNDILSVAYQKIVGCTLIAIWKTY